jgi:hypothetical protein
VIAVRLIAALPPAAERAANPPQKRRDIDACLRCSHAIGEEASRATDPFGDTQPHRTPVTHDRPLRPR